MANFLGEVLQVKGTLSFEELTDALKSLEGKISSLKIGVVQSMHSTFTLYETDLDRVIQWYTEIEELQKQLTKLDKQLHEDMRILQSANQDLDGITDDFSCCQQNITLLHSLVRIVKILEKSDPTDYYLASEQVREAEQELVNLTFSFQTIEDQAWIKQLRARFTDLSVDIYDICRKEWSKLFKFDKNCLIVSQHSVDPVKLIKSLKNIKSFSRLWDKFCNLVWQELYKPACTREYLVEVKASHLLESGDMLKDDVIIKTRRLEKPYANATILYENLISLAKTFNSIFSFDEMISFSDNIAPKVCQELQTKYLKTLILQRCGDSIEKARADLAGVSEFLQEVTEHNFILPENNPFQHIEQNFNLLFKAQVRESVQVRIRDLIRADVHDTIEVTTEAVPNASGSSDKSNHRNAAPKTYHISKTIAEVVALLKDHMKKYPKDYMICANAFSLFFALVKVPKHESESGDLVPLTAVLIHNNSNYLAYQAEFVFEEVDDLAPDLRLKANQAISFMMRCVRSSLNELITTAMSAIQERVDRNIDITHDFLVITAELKRLNSILSPMLPTSSWNNILATLVDHTVNELCLKVLVWEDIPANCATELANAFTQFAAATSSLFKGDASTPREVEALTARAVKKWERFRLVIFVLTASMKEIETKWVGGCGPLANEFTPEEVRKLVRALFQNTDRRAAFLATIK